MRMPESKQNFLDPKVLEEAKKQFEELATFNLDRDAYDFAHELQKTIKAIPAGNPLLQEYEDLAIKSLWLALPFLKEEEIPDLFEKHFVKALEIPFFDPWEKLKSKLLVLLLIEDRDQLKKNIMEALSRNQKVFTEESISQYEEVIKGTLGNWVKDYVREQGILPVSPSSQAQYLVGSPNTKKLSEKTREKLAQFLKFYERLKLSSATSKGYEAVIPVIEKGWEGSIKEGVYTKLDPKVGKLVDELFRRREEEQKKSPEYQKERGQKVFSAYGGDLKKQEMVNKEIDQIQKAATTEEQKVQYFFSAAFPPAGGKPNEEKVLASLTVLAGSGAFPDMLRKEKEIQDRFSEYLKEKNRTADIQGFTLNPTAPQYVKLFLRWILVERLGLSESESARFAIQLFNILKQAGKDGKYGNLAYFDMKEQKFRWA
jgi:hypothetical protein